MHRTKKKAVGIPTIDVSLVVVRTGTEDNGLEIAVDTANKIRVEPQTETTNAVKLVKLGRLLAQKPSRTRSDFSRWNNRRRRRHTCLQTASCRKCRERTGI